MFFLFLLGLILILFLVIFIILKKQKAFNTPKEFFHEAFSLLKKWILYIWGKPQTRSITASLISIFCGMIIGSVILLSLAGHSFGGLEISKKSGFDAIKLIFAGVFNTGRNASGVLTFGFNGVNIGNALFNATPLIMVGLSVALAFNTGLFNIGTPGQYLMGTAVSLIIALSINTSVVPAFLVWIFAFIGGILAGALWGCIPGFFKAFLNVNEVITCIMTNWIAANLVTSLFDNNIGPFKYLLNSSGTKNWAYVYDTSHNGVATAKFGLDKIFAGSQVNGGIFIAIIIAVIVFIVLFKTTFGYELRACGSNRDAAKYAGINEKRNIILSMAIAGGLAGAGASLYYLSGNTEFYWSTYQTLPGIAFNGIPVALLASNNPIGVIFSAVFMAYLDVCGMQLKYMTSYNEFITSIIVAIIVYFSAFALLIKQLLSGNYKFRKRPKKNKESASMEVVK